jgi:hypothetical protein
VSSTVINEKQDVLFLALIFPSSCARYPLGTMVVIQEFVLASYFVEAFNTHQTM